MTTLLAITSKIEELQKEILEQTKLTDEDIQEVLEILNMIYEDVHQDNVLKVMLTLFTPSPDYYLIQLNAGIDKKEEGIEYKIFIYTNRYIVHDLIKEYLDFPVIMNYQDANFTEYWYSKEEHPEHKKLLKDFV